MSSLVNYRKTVSQSPTVSDGSRLCLTYPYLLPHWGRSGGFMNHFISDLDNSRDNNQLWFNQKKEISNGHAS